MARQLRMTCDRNGCDCEELFDLAAGENLSRPTDRAHQAGWDRRPVRNNKLIDLCPRCCLLDKKSHLFDDIKRIDAQIAAFNARQEAADATTTS